jgi:hypothetical protein
MLRHSTRIVVSMQHFQMYAGTVSFRSTICSLLHLVSCAMYVDSQQWELPQNNSIETEGARELQSQFSPVFLHLTSDVFLSTVGKQWPQNISLFKTLQKWEQPRQMCTYTGYIIRDFT